MKERGEGVLVVGVMRITAGIMMRSKLGKEGREATMGIKISKKLVESVNKNSPKDPRIIGLG